MDEAFGVKGPGGLQGTSALSQHIRCPVMMDIIGGEHRDPGMAVRCCTQYLSDHFTNQIKFWGIQPSYAFVAEPQTNGVAERFNRTLKEQIIHGRIYRNLGR